MNEMTSIERIGNILKRKPVDRIGVFEHFWGDTQQAWAAKGKIREGEDLADHFDFDFRTCWNMTPAGNLDIEDKIIEETEDTILLRDKNHALLRTHKHHASTPEHVDFAVKDRSGWEELIKP